MSLTPITQLITQIAHVPDRTTMEQPVFDQNATQFADEIRQMAADMAAWTTQANALAVAINLALNLGIGNSDFLRFVRSPGDILYTACPTPPVGTLVCDGTAVSRADYHDLFIALNTGTVSTPCTISVGAPCIVTAAAHGFTGHERLRFSTGGSLPVGLGPAVDYFVVPIDADTFYLSSTVPADTLVGTTGAGSGNHTYLCSLWGLGDGSSTFNLPNLLGLFPAGVSAYRTINSGRAPARTLARVHASQNQSHAHPIVASATISDGGGAHGQVNFYSGDPGGGQTSAGPANSWHTHIVSVSATVHAQGGAEAYPWHVGLLPCIVC